MLKKLAIFVFVLFCIFVEIAFTFNYLSLRKKVTAVFSPHVEALETSSDIEQKELAITQNDIENTEDVLPTTSETVEKEDTKELSNCKIATTSFYSKNEVEEDQSDNVGVIPVYNEQFIFINDSISDNNSNIILYDLKNNKVLSKYENVDIGAYTKEVLLTHIKDATTYIMAKNKSGKYGVIKIEKDNVKSAIAFNYTEIEKLKEYYLGKESSETYVLLDNTGKEISSKYGFKITNYLNFVYDFKGNKIDETGYAKIILDKDYYYVITADNKLDIKKYNDINYGLKEPISVTTNNVSYKVEPIATGFKVTINNDTKELTYDDLK